MARLKISAHNSCWILDQHLISWICISKDLRCLMWARWTHTRFHCIHSSYWNRKKPISFNSSSNIVSILKMVLQVRLDSSLTSWSQELRKTYMHKNRMQRTGVTMNRTQNNQNHIGHQSVQYGLGLCMNVYWLKKMTPTTILIKMMRSLKIIQLTIVKIIIKRDKQIYLKIQRKTIPRRMSSKLNMDLMS